MPLRRTVLFVFVVVFLGVASTASAGVPFVVSDNDFPGSVYQFHYYTYPNTAPVQTAKRTVINGVDQAISDPTMTNTGWEFGDALSPDVGFWAAPGPHAATSTSGTLTMGWDFRSVSNRIVKVELKTRNYLSQFEPHTAAALGDQIAAHVATPGSFGSGGYTEIYTYTSNGDGSIWAVGTGAVLDVTSLLPAAWLENPGLLELKLTYSQTPNPTIPGRHIQVFRDNSGAGEDGFLLRVSLEGAPGTPQVTLNGSGTGYPGAIFHIEATGVNCSSNDLLYGWVWDAPEATLHGYATSRTLVVSWPTSGTRTVSVSHPSCGGASASYEVTVEPGEPRVTVLPGSVYMFQPAGTALGRTEYSIFNYGTEPTTISVEDDGPFFTQSPSSVAVPAGEYRKIDVRGKTMPVGLHRHHMYFSGNGLTSYLIQYGRLIQLHVFSTDPTDGDAVPNRNRVDVTGSGSSVRFRNSGTRLLEAQVVTTQPWILPAANRVTIQPGGEVEVAFSIDRTLRPDAAEPFGSVTGEIGLEYETTSASARRASKSTSQGGTAATSLVTVVDTVPPSRAPGVIPALGSGERALFVPGVGHVAGSVGTFISDLSLVNLSRHKSLGSLQLYFNPQPGSAGEGSQSASVSSIQPGQPVALADLVGTVFDQQAQLGSLQIRSQDLDSLGVSATVFNSSNPAGTFGTTIPVARSDRGAKPGESVYLTGLRSDATHHTNLFIQEMSGSDVTVGTEFFTAAGAVIASRSDTVAGFALVQLGNSVPAGAVSAVMTNSGESGSVFAYATPVDRESGDTWAVSDWPRQFGYEGDEPVVIPVAGALRGANDTFFRTDASIMNTGATQAEGTLRYHDRNGPVLVEQISLGPRETRTLDDITASLFGITSDTVGFMTWTPTAGEVVITSRNFTTIEGDVATFGSGVPTLATASSLEPGGLIRFGGIDDATFETIGQGRPATFRTNFGIVETSGNAVKVRVTVRYAVPLALAQERAERWKELDVAANGLLLVSNLARAVIGDEREEILGDLRNLEVDFELSEGDGRVMVFTSSVDNGTGDSILSHGEAR